MAGPIKLLLFNRKYCHILGIYPPELNQNGISMNSTIWIFLISYALFFLSSGAFLLLEAKSMFEYGWSFFATFMTVCFACFYEIILWQIKNYWTFIETCERFIETREDSTITYRQLSEKLELLCRFFSIAFIATHQFVMLTVFLYTVINYYILDTGDESFVLFYPATWPFNWKTPLGYLVAWLVQYIGFFVTGLTAISVMNLFLGPCWLFIVMAADITKDLAAFNKDLEANTNRAEWMKCFCDVIQIYSDAKQCVNKFNAFSKFLYFAVLFFLMLSVTSMLLTLQFQIMDRSQHNSKLFETIGMSIIGFWVFFVAFVLCEIGERVTIKFELFGEEVERCDWYVLSIEMQRMYLIFLSDTQQPKHITCYGAVHFTRETFKEVFKETGLVQLSYFMTIRKFEV